MSNQSFNDLWESSENKSNIENIDINQTIDNIILQFNLYKLLNDKVDNSSLKEINLAKQKIIGEILFNLSKISYKDNINIFISLLDKLT